MVQRTQFLGGELLQHGEAAQHGKPARYDRFIGRETVEPPPQAQTLADRLEPCRQALGTVTRGCFAQPLYLLAPLRRLRLRIVQPCCSVPAVCRE